MLPFTRSLLRPKPQTPPKFGRTNPIVGPSRPNLCRDAPNLPETAPILAETRTTSAEPTQMSTPRNRVRVASRTGALSRWVTDVDRPLSSIEYGERLWLEVGFATAARRLQMQVESWARTPSRDDAVSARGPRVARFASRSCRNESQSLETSLNLVELGFPPAKPSAEAPETAPPELTQGPPSRSHRASR